MVKVFTSLFVKGDRAYVYCGQRQNRTADPLFFRQVLYRLSYLARAGTTGFEPATSCRQAGVNSRLHHAPNDLINDNTFINEEL